MHSAPADRGGSGMHINFSFADRNGRNIIAPDGKLSYVANQAIAGLLAHHEGLAGLLAMTQNSYDRLTPGSMAGYWANWADDHRLVSVRSSSANPTTARLEHRTPDCATEDLDCLVNTRATRHVPSTLDEAMDALDADALLRTAVGEELCDAILYLKRDEHRRLVDKSVDEVRNFYLPFV